MTGLSMANSNLESKRLEALKDAFSSLKRVMILYDPTMGVSGLTDAQSGARALVIESLIVEAGDPPNSTPFSPGLPIKVPTA